jgi:hypothetical protein
MTILTYCRIIYPISGDQSSKEVFKIECALLIDMREHALVWIVSYGADIVIPRNIHTLVTGVSNTAISFLDHFCCRFGIDPN